MPSILLDYPNASHDLQTTVKFTTAIYGVHASGTSYRMDEVPIPLRKLVDSPYTTDEQILDQLVARLPFP